MKRHKRFLVFPFLLLVALSAGGIEDHNFPREILTNWLYHPEGTSLAIPVKVGTGLGRLVEQIPRNILCCNGYYSATLEIHGLGAVKDPGLYIPATGGLKSVEINGQLHDLPRREYIYDGAILPIQNLSKGKPDLLNLKIFIEGSRTQYSGMWFGNPSVGNISVLVDKHRALVTLQRYVPIANALVLFLICTIFIWLKGVTGTNDLIYRDFIFALIANATFFLFLAGVDLDISPYWGSVLHFPLSTVASLSVFYLICNFGNVPKKVISRFSAIYCVLGTIQLVASFLAFINIELFIVGVLRLPVIYAVFCLSKNIKTKLDKIIFSLSVILASGYLSDSLKCFALSSSLVYKIPFFDRYTTPPLLFGALFFLAYRLSNEITLQIRQRSFEEASSQFLHDIRSPMAALQVASQLGLESPKETNDIISIAISRINSISNSLVSYGQATQTTVQALKPCIEQILREVQVLYSSRPQIAIRAEFEETDRPIAAKININELSRVLSNLINNAVESIEHSGEVKIILGKLNQQPIIKIADNGKGMSAQLLETVGSRGISIGKPKGSGLGLYHARKTIESWGGKIQIYSEEHIGTKIHIIL